jgi:formylglycine-generating enzyme
VAQRNAQRAMLFVVGALLLSGASRPRKVAAHSQDERAMAQSTPRSTSASPGEPRAEPAQASGPADASTSSVPDSLPSTPMLHIPEGDYVPFYKGKNGAKAIHVPAFSVAARPVSREAFLRFVRRHPRWQRSHVQRLFAEATYLADWDADSNPGSAPAERAVTNVSWFAAKAYCKSVGSRLPSTVEWERTLKVVGASFTDSVGGATAPLAAALWEWTADFNSVPLTDTESSDSVANLFCGAGARATDASDYGAFLRYSFRSSLKADFALRNLGFRCAGGAT